MIPQYNPGVTLGFKNKKHISQNRNVSRYRLYFLANKNAWGWGEGWGAALWARTYLHFQVIVTKNGFTLRRKQKQKTLHKCRPICR